VDSKDIKDFKEAMGSRDNRVQWELKDILGFKEIQDMEGIKVTWDTKVMMGSMGSKVPVAMRESRESKVIKEIKVFQG